MADLSRPQKLNGAYYYPNAYPVGENRRQARSYSDSSSGRRCGLWCCCRCLCITLATIILLLGIAMLVVYLMFFPKLPKYTVEELKIQKLNVSGSRTVDSDIVLAIRADNPNKKAVGIKYRSINTELFYSGTRLGSSSVPAFYQGKRNVTVIRSHIAGSRVPVSQAVATSLKNSLARNSVALSSTTNVRARIKLGKLTTPAITVRVNCNLRASSPSATGGARLLGKSCKARVRKIW